MGKPDWPRWEMTRRQVCAFSVAVALACFALWVALCRTAEIWDTLAGH